jgi:hypothetical protein
VLLLLLLLSDKPYATDVATIDVANFSGRAERQAPQLIQRTLSDMEIRWGRPAYTAEFWGDQPTPNDFFVEVSVEQKLKHLAEISGGYANPTRNPGNTQSCKRIQ